MRAYPVIPGTDLTYGGKYNIHDWCVARTSAPILTSKLELLAGFFNPGDLVFDIGANSGDVTWVLRQLGALVVSVEPLHEIAPERVKEFHYKFRNDPGVILLPLAIAPTNSTNSVNLTMPDIGDPHWIVTSASERWCKTSAHKNLYARKVVRKTVTAITLDDMVRYFGLPSFIKIDVEGFDGEVVSTLSYPVPVLNMEFHSDWLWNNLMGINHLNKIGNYEYNYALDNSPDLSLSNWMNGKDLIDHLSKTLTNRGDGSWGDIYARLIL